MDEWCSGHYSRYCMGTVLADLKRNYGCIPAVGDALDVSASAGRSVNEFMLENIIAAVAVLSNRKRRVGSMDENING